MFEDFNDNLAVALRNPHFPGHLQVDAVRIVDPRIGAAFVSRNLDLGQLSSHTWSMPRISFKLVREPGLGNTCSL